MTLITRCDNDTSNIFCVTQRYAGHPRVSSQVPKFPSSEVPKFRSSQVSGTSSSEVPKFPELEVPKFPLKKKLIEKQMKS